ncbi:methylmalonyl Co-A mutase-associated GTPase MeaB [Gemmatimonadota bacterium]
MNELVDHDALIAGVLRGEWRAMARAISIVEDSRPGRVEILAQLYLAGRTSSVCGITGPSGAGKSTLVDALASRYRVADERVGIVCVDPTSPFSGGALLGDRIRMNEIVVDPGVFIRSMATRGSRGGLGKAAREVISIVEASGTERVIVETVGVGQIELDVAEAADTVVVVLVPESGDGIQAMKAGLMEIGDVFVVNKADRDGADGLRIEIESVLALRSGQQWRPPVLTTIASHGQGIEELADAIDSHRQWLVASGDGERRRRHRIITYVKEIVLEALATGLWEEGGYRDKLEDSLMDIIAGRKDPFTVADEIVTASGMLASLKSGTD